LIQFGCLSVYWANINGRFHLVRFN